MRGRRARNRRRRDERVTRETIAERALHLPPPARALMHAHYSLGMKVDEIAQLHGITPRQMRRRIDRLRDMVSDPCFLLMVRFGERLPAEIFELARAHWMEGMALRQLSAARSETLHRVRQGLAVARSLLVVAMSGEQAVPPELARAAIDVRRSDGK